MEQLYRCYNCGSRHKEEDMDIVRTTYEDMYGVSDEFVGSTSCSYYVCPTCGSDEVDEFIYYEDEDDEE